jgi:hypothetical protein
MTPVERGKEASRPSCSISCACRSLGSRICAHACGGQAFIWRTHPDVQAQVLEHGLARLGSTQLRLQMKM